MSNNKNFVFSERVKLEHHLNCNMDVSAIKLARILNRSRSSIYYELKHFSTVKETRLHAYTGKDDYECPLLERFPFVCNGCANTRCSHQSRYYSAYEAQRKADKLLHDSRSDNSRRKEVVKILNRSVCPLIKDGLSIHVAKNSVNNCDLSESTIRRYIEKGYVDAKRIDLPRAVRFKAKKEYDYKLPPLSANILDGRTYDDYRKYMEAYPDKKVVQLDSVIGRKGDDKAILTIYFNNSKLQIGRLYNRKNARTVDTMRKLYSLGKENGVKLFDVVLADNGSEFKNLYELEKDEEGNEICKVFYCDPYRSCQKAECEKNHGLFRRIYPKGISMDELLQEEVDEIFSHINSYPRASLSDKSPYDLFALEYKSIILSLFNIFKVDIKDIRMKDYRTWGHKK